MTEKEYVASGGSKCLNCGSTDIESDHITADGSDATAEVECLECHATWVDTYALVGLSNLQVPS